MRGTTSRATRKILLLIAILVLTPLFGGAAPGSAQTEDQEDAGLTSETSYESPELGFRVEWDDPWEVAGDSPSTEDGGPDELILLGEDRDEMRDQINFFGVSNDERPSGLLERLTENRLDDEDAYPDAELVEERYDAEPPSATITWLFQGDLIVQYSEVHAIEEDETVLVIDLFVPEGDFDDAFSQIGGAVTVNGDPLFEPNEDDGAREETEEQSSDDSAEAVFRGGAAHTGVQPGPGPVGELAVRWSIEMTVPDSGPVPLTSPSFLDDTIFVVRSDGLHAVDAGSGDEMWHYEADAINGDTPAVADDTVYFAGYDGIFAVDADSGELRWRAEGEGGDETALVVADGRVHLNSDGRLVAFDSKTGEELWRVHNGAFKGRHCTPTVADGVVYSGGQLQADGENYPMLRALDAESGEDLWIIETAEPPCSPPAVSNGVVYAGGGENGILFAVDADNGDEIWEYTVPRSNRPVPSVAGGIVYVGDSDGTLTALDAATGDVVWDAELGGYARYSVVVEDQIYAVAGSKLVILDAATGEQLAELDGLTETSLFGGEFIGTSPLVVDGSVYVTTDEGMVAIEGEE